MVERGLTSRLAQCLPGRFAFGYKQRFFANSSLLALQLRGHVLRVVVCAVERTNTVTSGGIRALFRAVLRYQLRVVLRYQALRGDG